MAEENAPRNTHRVLRQFRAAGGPLKTGDLVDASDWKNREALESQRYIQRIEEGGVPTMAHTGPTPDPKLIQESKARAGRRSGRQTEGGIAPMAEVEDELAAAGQGEASSRTEQSATSLRGKLPADFPGHAALEAHGITSYGKLRTFMGSNELTSIPNIGDATAAKIEEVMSASTDEDRAADEAEA